MFAFCASDSWALAPVYLSANAAIWNSFDGSAMACSCVGMASKRITPCAARFLAVLVAFLTRSRCSGSVRNSKPPFSVSSSVFFALFSPSDIASPTFLPASSSCLICCESSLLFASYAALLWALASRACAAARSTACLFSCDGRMAYAFLAASSARSVELSCVWA